MLWICICLITEVLIDFLSSPLGEYYASFEHLCYFKQTGELRGSLLMLHEQGSKDVILLADDFRDRIINQQ